MIFIDKANYMNNNYMLTAAICGLTIMSTIVHGPIIYNIICNELEHVPDYATDFWPNRSPDPWNESLLI